MWEVIVIILVSTGVFLSVCTGVFVLAMAYDIWMGARK